MSDIEIQGKRSEIIAEMLRELAQGKTQKCNDLTGGRPILFLSPKGVDTSDVCSNQLLNFDLEKVASLYDARADMVIMTYRAEAGSKPKKQAFSFQEGRLVSYDIGMYGN